MNGEHGSIEDATYDVRLQGAGGKAVIGTGKAPASLAADSVTALPEVDCSTPQDLPRGCYELVLTLKEGSQTVSEDSYEVLVTH